MKYLKQMIPLQRAEEILRQHIQEKKPFSLIRINDGETRAIGYNIFINTKQLPGWYRYTGVDTPTEAVRGALIRAIKEADLVGLPTRSAAPFRPLTEKILTKYQLRPKLICNTNINRWLYHHDGLARLVKGQRLLLLGKTIRKVIPAFRAMGAKVVAAETVNGFADIQRVLQYVRTCPDFDLALVSAGIPAKPICTSIRRFYGKVAIDLGHVPEMMLYPGLRYGEIIRKWLKEHPAAKSS